MTQGEAERAEAEAREELWNYARTDEQVRGFGDAIKAHAEAVRRTERLKAEALVEAASHFDGFYAFMQAMEEMGEFEKPLTEHTCVVSLMGGGASDYLWVADFMKLRAALTAYQEGAPRHA